MFAMGKSVQTQPMKKDSTNFELLSDLWKFLDEKSLASSAYATQTTAFSRDRVLTFKMVAVFILHMAKKSLSVELAEFFERLDREWQCVTKSALSQARYKLKWKFYEDWNKVLITSAYKGSSGYTLRRYKGFYLYGIDATKVYLVNNAEMCEEFGTQGNAKVKVAMAQAVCRYDVVNQLCDYAHLGSIHEDELGQALAQVPSLSDKSIGIHDRGHASFALVYYYIIHGKYFLIRCPPTFNTTVKAFVQSGAKSANVTIKGTKAGIERLQAMGVSVNAQTTIGLRFVRIELSSGQTEVLMTNLPRKQFTRKRLSKLYFMRWGIETYFDRLKNKLQIEKFSGHKPQAIYQEFHAMILLSNLHAQFVGFCRKAVQQTNKGRRYEYQTNYNVTLGLLNKKLVAIFLLDKLTEIISTLRLQFIRYVEPIRPDRALPRTTKTRRSKGKYQTMTNYRQAA